MSEKISLIVGLGNPGQEYAHTRHNAGADFVLELANTFHASWSEEKKFSGLVTQCNIGGEPVRLLQPLTYMNLSGQSVSAIANYYRIAPQHILIAHDELDLPPGTARLKLGGGHGGHNGLRDIINALGNQNSFARLRIGIGHPGHAKLVSNYVLKRAPLPEFEQIASSIEQGIRVLPDLVRGNMEKAMHTLHSTN